MRTGPPCFPSRATGGNPRAGPRSPCCASLFLSSTWTAPCSTSRCRRWCGICTPLPIGCPAGTPGTRPGCRFPHATGEVRLAFVREKGGENHAVGAAPLSQVPKVPWPCTGAETARLLALQRDEESKMPGIIVGVDGSDHSRSRPRMGDQGSSGPSFTAHRDPASLVSRIIIV
jgi:hypothetical protein